MMPLRRRAARQDKRRGAARSRRWLRIMMDDMTSLLTLRRLQRRECRLSSTRGVAPVFSQPVRDSGFRRSLLGEMSEPCLKAEWPDTEGGRGEDDQVRYRYTDDGRLG